MTPEPRTIAVTGTAGFLGSNLVVRLTSEGHDVRPITRETDPVVAEGVLGAADVVFHLAGVNRPEEDEEFWRSNRDYTAWVGKAAVAGGRKPLLVLSSSLKATDDSPYGQSKRAGEDALLRLSADGAATVSIWRLPNLCGKWSRPDYNSVVATFCHNAARGLPLRIDDPSTPLALLYVDDLIDEWLGLIDDPPTASGFAEPRNVHGTTVGEVARLIQGYADERARGEVRDVETGLGRILYPSFVAALPIARANYPLPSHNDARGSFVEILKIAGGGQFSYFSARPGVTRGGHYHHSKVEKFLVAHGTGRFRFRQILSGENFELVSSASEPLMIETIPGWAHDVTNIGDDELVVLTWASERFDPERPDTYPMPL